MDPGSRRAILSYLALVNSFDTQQAPGKSVYLIVCIGVLSRFVFSFTSNPVNEYVTFEILTPHMPPFFRFWRHFSL